MGRRDLPYMYAHKQRAECIHIRQITNVHVTSDACITFGTLEIYPSLKCAANLLHIVISTHCDYGTIV